MYAIEYVGRVAVGACACWVYEGPVTKDEAKMTVTDLDETKNAVDHDGRSRLRRQ